MGPACQDVLAARRDVRDWRIVSIDPATARDLDDALSVRALDDGTFEVGVHIADVSYFVPDGSALDNAARQRATTVYMVQRAIPMLPRLLSEVCVWAIAASGQRCAGGWPAWVASDHHVEPRRWTAVASRRTG